MSDNYFRVQATVTYVGEWFVLVDENIQSADDAAAYVRSDVEAMQGPENYIEDPTATVDLTHIWVTDEDGDPIK